MCQFEGQRESPPSPEFGKMRGGGGGFAPPRANRVKMGHSKKFCFRIFLTLKAREAQNCLSIQIPKLAGPGPRVVTLILYLKI